MQSAPRFNLLAGSSSTSSGQCEKEAAESNGSNPTQPARLPQDADQALQARAVQFLQENLAKTENVGDHLAEEARRMH